MDETPKQAARRITTQVLRDHGEHDLIDRPHKLPNAFPYMQRLLDDAGLGDRYVLAYDGAVRSTEAVSQHLLFTCMPGDWVVFRPDEHRFIMRTLELPAEWAEVNHG